MIFSITTGTRIFILTLILSTLFVSQTFAQNCKEAGKQLRGEFEMTQSKGGIWGYMEQAGALKKDSTIGLQVDAKMQRLVVYFESECQEGKPELQATLKNISLELGNARQIVNKTPGRTPIKTIMQMITTLNGNLDKMMGELGL